MRMGPNIFVINIVKVWGICTVESIYYWNTNETCERPIVFIIEMLYLQVFFLHYIVFNRFAGNYYHYDVIPGGGFFFCVREPLNKKKKKKCLTPYWHYHCNYYLCSWSLAVYYTHDRNSFAIFISITNITHTHSTFCLICVKCNCFIVTTLAVYEK